MKNKYGQARLDIQLVNDIITVYQGDWDKIFYTLQKLSDMADLKEKAVKDMRNQLDNMNAEEILNLANILNIK